MTNFIPRYDLSKPWFSRALWIIGNSACGKSTFAKQIKSDEETILECGKFVRDLHSPDATVFELTATTYSMLGKDHKHFSKKIEDALKDQKNVIVVGARNPTDFVHNFRPKSDGVVFLDGIDYLASTDFECYGIKAIKAYVDFLIAINQVSMNQVSYKLAK